MFNDSVLKMSLAIIVNSIVASFICVIMVFTFSGFIVTSWGGPVYEVLAILIMGSLIYGVSWQSGFKDYNKVKFGHITKFIRKGFVAGAIADIPFLILYIVFIISFLIKTAHDVFYNITYIVYLFFNMPYSLIIGALKNQPAFLCLFLLVLPIISGIGYILGYKDISLTGRLVYKNSKNIAKLRR